MLAVYLTLQSTPSSADPILTLPASCSLCRKRMADNCYAEWGSAGAEQMGRFAMAKSLVARPQTGLGRQ
jgi:hypothetical protein